MMREPLMSTVTPGAISDCIPADQGIGVRKPLGAGAERFHARELCGPQAKTA